MTNPRKVNSSVKSEGISIRVICPTCNAGGSHFYNEGQPGCHKCKDSTKMEPASNDQVECTWAEYGEYLATLSDNKSMTFDEFWAAKVNLCQPKGVWFEPNCDLGSLVTGYLYYNDKDEQIGNLTGIQHVRDGYGMEGDFAGYLKLLKEVIEKSEPLEKSNG